MMKALKTSSILLLVLFMGSTLCWAAGSEEKAVEKPVVEKTGPVVDEWVLPCVTQLTGPFAAFFEQGVFAMKEAQKEINAAGGILGRPLRIMFYDEGPDPTTASPVVAKVLDTKPIAILGPGVGDNARATVPMIKKEGMMATPVATGVGAVLDWVEPESWVLQFLDFDERTAKPGVMEWIRREPEIKKVVQFVFPKYELYISYAQLQKEALESMGVEVVMIDVTEEQVNLAPIAVQALSYKPDGFLMTILSVPCAKLIIELDKRGVKDKSTICMFGTVDDPQLYETGKGYLDGAYMWTYFDEFNPNPRWQSLVKRWQTAHPEASQPTFVLWMYYDLVYYTAKAMEAAKVTGDPKKLKEERAAIRQWMLNQKDFDFVIPGKCDVVNGIKKQPVSLNMVKDNKKTFVTHTRLPY